MAGDRAITRQQSDVSHAQRSRLLGQSGAVIWLTGLSGSGKSTLAFELERRLVADGHAAFVLDGDNVRDGLSRDLGFSADDRRENIRRVGEVAGLMADAGLITICAFISPYAADRARARAVVGEQRFIEVYLDVDLAVCEKRDPKGLYRRARAGEIEEFTGISAPYEAPAEPDLRVDTDGDDIETCVGLIQKRLVVGGFLRCET